VYAPDPPPKRPPSLDLLEWAMAIALAVVAGVFVMGMCH
jgi:hypothetical protein